jgi:hypothetical protein
MHIAVIAPTHSLELIHRRQFHMALAQHLVESQAYLDFYRQQRFYDCHIIVDNGAAEGEQVTLSDLISVANMVGADEVCLPDVLFDAEATVAASTRSDVLEQIPPHARMVIPQGTSVAQWFSCLLELQQRINFRSIGVPKHLERYKGGRMKACELIEEHFGAYGYNIHLLGVNNEPIAELSRLANKFGNLVRSVDTAAPIAYAQRNEFVCDCHHWSLDWNVAPDATRARVNIEILDRVAADTLYHHIDTLTRV